MLDHFSQNVRFLTCGFEICSGSPNLDLIPKQLNDFPLWTFKPPEIIIISIHSQHPPPTGNILVVSPATTLEFQGSSRHEDDKRDTRLLRRWMWNGNQITSKKEMISQIEANGKFNLQLNSRRTLIGHKEL